MAVALPPILGSLEEICIVTPDIHRTIDGLSRLGIGPFRIFAFDAKTVEAREYRSAAGDFTLTVGFATIAQPSGSDLVFEIMQPESGASLMADFLRENGGREGIQHIAFDLRTGEKESIAARIQRMGERGIQPAMRGVWKGKTGTCEFCFFDTRDLAGTVFETIEFSDDWEEPEGGVWYPHPPVGKE